MQLTEYKQLNYNPEITGKWGISPCDPDELNRAVAGLTIAASANAIEARRAEIAAVREELAIQSRENAQRFEATNGKRLRAEEKALRAKSNLAFLAAKGTRGDFARLWPSVYLREVRNRCCASARGSYRRLPASSALLPQARR